MSTHRFDDGLRTQRTRRGAGCGVARAADGGRAPRAVGQSWASKPSIVPARAMASVPQAARLIKRSSVRRFFIISSRLAG